MLVVYNGSEKENKYFANSFLKNTVPYLVQSGPYTINITDQYYVEGNSTIFKISKPF